MRPRLGALVVVLGLVAVGSGGCGKKKSTQDNGPSPEVTGLAAVPMSAQVVVGADVGKLAGSPIVQRAVEQLLLHDSTLSDNWQHVQDTCKLDLTKQIKHVMLALGAPPAGAQPGTGPVLMIATGSIAENDLATCVRTMVGKGGGTLTAKPFDGRTLYQVKDGNRVVYFAFGRADTVVLSASDQFVLEALSNGKKALDNPELKTVIALADQSAPMWAAGKVPELVRVGLVGASNGELKSGPTAFVGSFDPSDGAKVDFGAVMASNEDAKTLETFANNEIKLLGMYAQAKSMGSIVSKIAIKTEGSVLRFRAALTMDEVNQLLHLLDVGAPPAQGSPPPAGSGSQSPK